MGACKSARKSSLFRAMHSFVRKHPDCALDGGKGGQPLWLVARRRAQQLTNAVGGRRDPATV
jgi:hypothetical protein